MKEESSQDLGLNKADLTASIGKSIAGIAPFVGPAIQEIVSNVIPNQRIDRIAKFIAKLDEKLRDFGEEQLKAKLADPANVDLMEDAFFQAARAFIDERIDYIASLVKNGMTSEDLERIQVKKILWLLGELNDAELMLLHAYNSLWGGRNLSEELRALIQGPFVHMASSEEEQAKAAIHESYKEHLLRLDLLACNYRSARVSRRDEPITIDDFDHQTGKLKGGHVEIGQLGRLLLQYVGLNPE